MRADTWPLWRAFGLACFLKDLRGLGDSGLLQWQVTQSPCIAMRSWVFYLLVGLDLVVGSLRYPIRSPLPTSIDECLHSIYVQAFFAKQKITNFSCINLKVDYSCLLNLKIAATEIVECYIMFCTALRCEQNCKRLNSVTPTEGTLQRPLLAQGLKVVSCIQLFIDIATTNATRRC